MFTTVKLKDLCRPDTYFTSSAARSTLRWPRWLQSSRPCASLRFKSRRPSVAHKMLLCGEMLLRVRCRICNERPLFERTQYELRAGSYSWVRSRCAEQSHHMDISATVPAGMSSRSTVIHVASTPITTAALYRMRQAESSRHRPQDCRFGSGRGQLGMR